MGDIETNAERARAWIEHEGPMLELWRAEPSLTALLDAVYHDGLETGCALPCGHCPEPDLIAEAEARGRAGADEELRQARIAREADDLAWRKRWEKAEARAAEGVLVVASLLETQEYGHRRDDAINGTCKCRWCRAHRLVPDSMSGEAEKKGGG